jgi:RNA polymerase sigma-70 factor (ECF subfamily)
MTSKSKTVKASPDPSSTGTYVPKATPGDTQLSPGGRVHSNVSSAAIDSGLLAMSYDTPYSEAQGVVARPLAATGDAEVMLRVKAGDDAAFEYLVQKYRRPMVSYMYRMSHNVAAAEDLAQEVFLRVYRSRANYEPSAKFATWLYRIATNLAVNHARDSRHERPETSVSIDEPDQETGLALDLPDTSLSAEEALLRRERMAAIRQRVQSLPERQRTAVVMHKYQQMDYHQIAEVLKLSESATKSLLFRAYETLRVQLKEFL